MTGKVYIKTHGCQMNEYDSARMADLMLEKHGLEVTEVETEADVILINTCSIREKAQEKVFSQLGRWRKLKENNPQLVIGVGGCVASQEGEDIIKRAPFVDVVFGPQTMHRLPELVSEVKNSGKAQVDISFPEIEKFDSLPEPSVQGASAFVSIMEGCSKYCSFCVVPYTRGEEVSRPVDDVISEIVGLVEQGVKEVNLLGQNVNAYHGLSHDGELIDLAMLIRYVASIDGIERIRYTTSHPVEFSDSLIDVYKDEPKLVSFLHLPVQSGSDRILAAMKRGHTVLEYKAKIRALKKARPELCLSSDFIVGFPGETEHDFEQTMKLIEELKFDQSFSFIYSRRPGTPASDLPDSVTLDEKKQRLQRLQARINEFSREISQQMVGTMQKVLVEGQSKRGSHQLSARTANNRVVNFDGHPRLIGQMIDVVITEALNNSLRGRMVLDA